IATILYDINSCVMLEVLKEVRIPVKSSYFLEQYRYSERIFAARDRGSGQVTAAVRPKQCAGQPL
ncbi:hypothetical protein HAX54_051590, partial [Datura stramonium]|nr:hypothetical protein [Datura stramonium]